MQVAQLLIGSIEATWEAYGEKIILFNTYVEYLQWLEPEFHAFTIEKATMRWPNIKWSEFMSTLAYGMHFT